MKRIFTFLGLTIFTFISCSENNSGAKKTEDFETDNEYKTETKNVGIVTNDEHTISSSSDIIDPITYTKEFDLYLIRDLEESANKKVGFISLSDIYPLGEHPDSLAIPSLENVDKDSLQYFKLNLTYRKRFLSKTNISESDSVFIYDYSTDVLLSFPVRKLNVVAYLNIYMDINDCPCSQYDFMIGFEIVRKYLKGLGENFSKALVFIGKENPFVTGQMKAIVWQKIKPEKFPLEKSNLTEVQKQNNDENKQAYLCETDNYQIFIQDYIEPDNPIQVQDRHLIVIEKQRGNVVNETMFSNSEGTSATPLNYGINNSNFHDLKEQWTGKLFKDKPEVIFGFEWVSFGCPIINYLNSQDKCIQINCDNRH
ncbi:hypothetical protein [Sporocytophaga myxococcoides]|uniref:hypothetical protein n=1 Tax=Sporocytophaga myxococcoides TaxID=153721 RepID=UPI0004077EBD|nr:hypothetical protein [Sporocytophaga myxococcoides]